MLAHKRDEFNTWNITVDIYRIEYITMVCGSYIHLVKHMPWYRLGTHQYVWLPKIFSSQSGFFQFIFTLIVHVCKGGPYSPETYVLIFQIILVCRVPPVKISNAESSQYSFICYTLGDMSVICIANIRRKQTSNWPYLSITNVPKCDKRCLLILFFLMILSCCGSGSGDKFWSIVN